MDTTLLSKGSPDSRRYGGHSKRIALLAMAGAISGFLLGLGAEVVLAQGGHVNLDVLWAWPQLSGIAIGIAWALVKLPTRYRKWEKLFTIGLALVALVLALFILAPPASAQVPCDPVVTDVVVTIEGRSSSLFETTRDAPLLIDLDTAGVIGFAASTEEVTDGVVEVVVDSVTPFNPIVEPGGTVVYYDQISGGASSALLSIERSGPTGFVATAPGGFTSPILPLGLVELSILLDELSSGELRSVCSHTAWIQPVARPATNRIGLLGTAACAVGLAGIGVVRTGRNRLDQSSEDQLSDDTSQPTPTVTVTPGQGSSEITTDDRRPVTAISVAVAPGRTITTLTEDNPS
jgi:hypothetical protein